MKKIIIAMLMVIMTIGVGHAQLPSSFPPKSYPASILVVTDPGVAKYWDVKRIMYLGPGNGGHKFRVFGSANADHRAANVEMFYIRHDDKLQSAGAYFFPEVKKGDAFNFDIVSAFTGYAPKSFLGFMIKDDMFPAQNAVSEELNKNGQVSQIKKVDEVEDEIRISDKDEIRASQILDTEQESNVETGFQPAMFKGEKNGALKWIVQQLKTNKVVQDHSRPGRVIVKFTIGENGDVKYPLIVQGLDKELDRWVLFYVKKMGTWTPAKSNGKPVSSKIELPIDFR